MAIVATLFLGPIDGYRGSAVAAGSAAGWHRFRCGVLDRQDRRERKLKPVRRKPGSAGSLVRRVGESNVERVGPKSLDKLQSVGAMTGRCVGSVELFDVRLE